LAGFIYISDKITDMKKILLSLTILLSAHLIYAGGPLKFRAGIMALPHAQWMLSSGYSYTQGATKYDRNPQFTFNTNFGLAFGLNFTDALGIEVDVIFGKYLQDWKNKVSDPLLGSDSRNSTTEISKIDIPVLFKLGGLMYFEVGPQFTMISGVEEIVDGQDPDDVSDLYNTSQIFAIIGTGVGFKIPKIARIEAGLRLGYGFQDLSTHKKDANGFIIFNDNNVTQAFWGIKLAAVHEF